MKPITIDFPKRFDPTSCILFLGAGFSVGGKNLLRNSPPTGVGLEQAIKALSGLPDGDPSGLQDLARYAASRGDDLFGLLQNLYSVRSLNSDQETVLSQPWLRIYTTNYDDSVEHFWMYSKSQYGSNSYTLTEEPPSQIRKGSIIHLHGYIHACSRENILNELVLTHKSYAQQRAVHSPWWEIFERDLRVSSNIFFLGYELNDFEPASYLTKNPNTAIKTHFILRPSKSPVIESRLKDYGTRHSIAIDGFANECLSAEIGQKPTHANALQSFRYVDLLKDDKLSIQPSPLEIRSLFSFGKFNIKRLLSTFPRSNYINIRQDPLDSSVEFLSSSKTLIIHSKIGNGKSVFRYSLLIALSEKGHFCFELKENVTPSDADLEFIRNQVKAVIVFPDYDTAYAMIHLFSGMRSDARFIVEMNTSTLQVRQVEVFSRLPKPVERVDLNYLTQNDCNTIYRLLDNAGIAPTGFQYNFRRNSEFRDIVLSVFNNTSVTHKIDQLVNPLISNADAKLVLMCSAILKAAGVRTDPSFLRAISRVDSYQVLTEAGEQAFEFVDFSHDRVEPHSAIFSEFLIRRYLKSHELAGALFRMASEAAKRMNEATDTQSERAREARSVLSSLIRFSFLEDLLRGSELRDECISLVYENGRSDTYIQGEPLFWLQYSIFMQDAGEWDQAESHMDTAYKRGSQREGFLPYQLDTNSFGLIIELELRQGPADPVLRASRMIELLDKIRIMLSEGNHRGHAIKVLGKVESFISKRRTGLSRPEAVSLTYHLNIIIESLDNFSLDERAVIGSEPVKKSLARAVSMLTWKG